MIREIAPVPKIESKEAMLADLWGIFHRAVEKAPHQEFYFTKSGSLTRGEANRRANAVFDAIARAPFEKQVGVGLFLKDPGKIIPAILGVLKANCYFVPLDVTFPEATLADMIGAAGVKIVLTTDQHLGRIQSLEIPNVHLINLDQLDFKADIPNPDVRFSRDDLVQILFTSGSTGKPKGVLEDYRYLARATYLKLTDGLREPGDRVLQMASFTFAGAHTSIIPAIIAGHKIFNYDVKKDGFIGLREWILENEITQFMAGPTIFRNFVRSLGPQDTFPSVRRVSLGAEKKLRQDLVAVRRHFPAAEQLRLGFGSSETQTVATALFPIDYNFSTDVLPCGYPRPDIRVFIWDENGNEVPQGQEGEIVVYGDSLARGYLNEPELTRERFIPDPENPEFQYFRTADLGKFLPDGQLAHLGRIDHMVKIKGIRIEVSSIEKYMREYPGIQQAVAKGIEDANANVRLAAYFVAENDIPIPLSDLRKFLVDRLPLHLLPHYLIQVSEFPQTRTGKVDMNQLPPPNMVRPPLSHPYEPPADDLEETLAGIWEEIIGVKGIGVTDDFFDVGGDSLMGVLLFASIEEALGRNLPVSILLTAPTIRKQAEIIRREDTSADFSAVIPVNTQGSNPSLFFIPGQGGHPTRVRQLAQKLDSETPVYGLQEFDGKSNGAVAPSVETKAAFYLSQIRKVAPHGPYFFVGESSGGKVALEMAQQLAESNEQVPILALLDTFASGGYSQKDGRKISRLRYFVMLIQKHLSTLRNADWRGRLDYFRYYREKFPQKANDLIEQIKRQEETNRMANRLYQPRPYPGKLILFKALRSPNSMDPSNGWDKYQLGELAVHPLDCYHGNILFEPWVSEVGQILQEYISAYRADK